jgi:L-ascorbate metabolism protein UlaG (beta-lactamase superfamily)
MTHEHGDHFNADTSAALLGDAAIVKNRRLVRLGTARTSGVAGLPRTYLLIAHKAWLCTWF